MWEVRPSGQLAAEGTASPPCPASRNAGSWKPGLSQASRRIIAKPGHCSAGDTAQPGPRPADCCERGSRGRSGGLTVQAGPGLRSRLRARHPRPATRRPCRLHRPPSLPHICLAGAQPSPINTWPSPALRPQRLFTLRDGAPTRAKAKTGSCLGECEIPGPWEKGRLRRPVGRPGKERRHC